MKARSFLSLLVLLGPALLAGGCSGPPGNTDGGFDDTGEPPEDHRITVSGTVDVYPPAQVWLPQAGKPSPQVVGLRVRVEEPLYRVLGDPSGRFGEQELAEDGAFRVTDVPVAELTVGLVATVEDPTVPSGATARVAPVATILYDTTREGRRPLLDVRGRAWALPTSFLDALTRAVGAGAIAAIAPGKVHLAETGYVVGQVLDANGAPVAGVRVVPSPEDLVARVFYPTEDLSLASRVGTAGTGLFVLVHDGGDVRTFTLTVDGRPEYPQHSGMAARGTGMVMPVTPDLP
ncbi:MAG: hypothetical protein L0Y66_08590 [Myxococcaceae bacterium]|nr:hypothetical protein [Myxococcaceae bacterium]